MAPQGLEYVLGFPRLDAGGPHRCAASVAAPRLELRPGKYGLLADTQPSVVLTTSAAAEDVAEYLHRARLDAVPKIIEIDSMNLDAP